MTRQRVSVGRKTISYLAHEVPAAGMKGQPLRTALFLHAFPLNAEMWRPQLDAVPAGWRFVAPDYRCFGESSAAGGASASMNDLAGDAVDLLDALHVHQAVVAGCSMGGYVLLELLKSAPSYAAGIVLIDTRAGADTEEGRGNRRKMLDAVERGGAQPVADEMTPKLLGATTQRTRPELVSAVRATIAGTAPQAISLAVTAMMNRSDMTPLLSGISVPALIVAGAEDTLIPRAAMEQMHGAISGSQFVTIPGAGHLPNLEQPEAFNAELSKFLEKF